MAGAATAARRAAGALATGGGSSAAHVEPSDDSDSAATQRARSSRLGVSSGAGSAATSERLEARVVAVADREDDADAARAGERSEHALADLDAVSGRDPVGERALDRRVERHVGNHGPTLIACGARRTPVWRA